MGFNILLEPNENRSGFDYSRQNECAYQETLPRFGTGVDSMLEAVAQRRVGPRAKEVSLIDRGV